MELPVGWSIVLILTAVWNLIIWPRFWQRITKDDRARDAAGRRTTFYNVHAVLIGTSLVLALLCGLVGILAL